MIGWKLTKRSWTKMTTGCSPKTRSMSCCCFGCSVKTLNWPTMPSYWRNWTGYWQSFGSIPMTMSCWTGSTDSTAKTRNLTIGC